MSNQLQTVENNVNVQLFKNSELGEVRVIMMNDNPWFVAKDVAIILGYSDTEKLTRRLEDDEKLTSHFGDSGQIREMYIISEPGLYNAISGSKKPEAKTFQRWINHEVLPSIRKTGMYGKNLSRAGYLLEQAKILFEQEQRLNEIENKQNNHEKDINELKEINSKKADIKEILPPVNQMTTRKTLNEIVRSYCTRNKIKFNDAWGNLYKEFYYRYSKNITLCAKNRDVHVLDYCEEQGILPDLLSLAYELYAA